MRKTLQIGVATISILAIAGCSSMPGNSQQQGAVIGGASGAAVGAAVTKNRALGAVIGGAVGAAGGYVIGKNMGHDARSQEQAAQKSQQAPATAEAARTATTADVNNDGFVTLDEVVAMEQAGLTDDEMIRRLRATNQVFDLTEEQKKFLVDHGVSRNVVDQLATLNHEPPTSTTNPVISQPRL